MLGAPWIRNLREGARFRWFCFPYAGGGSPDFRALGTRMPADVELVPVLLPGRETRLGDTPIDDMGRLVTGLLEGLGPALRSAPFAFYGHSLGSWVAFEFTRALVRARRPLPTHLVAAARHAPHLPDTRPKIAHLPDAAFLDAVEQRYGPLPAVIRRDPQLMGLFLPALRADFGLLDAYRFVDAAPLPVPLSAWMGRDDAIVTRSQCSAWAVHTSAAFQLAEIPGGHFFLRDAADDVAQRLLALTP